MSTLHQHIKHSVRTLARTAAFAAAATLGLGIGQARD